MQKSEIAIPPLQLGGTLQVPSNARGLVLFAHGSGSSRFSLRNAAVAEALNQAGFGTLLLDLLTDSEEGDRSKVFDIPLLAGRLIDAVHWIDRQPALSKQPLGLFGASTGAAAALQVAAELGVTVKAVVSRGGRPDLAGASLAQVRSPTLLIIGGDDGVVLELNRQALEELTCQKAILAQRTCSRRQVQWTRSAVMLETCLGCICVAAPKTATRSKEGNVHK